MNGDTPIHSKSDYSKTEGDYETWIGLDWFDYSFYSDDTLYYI